jgi:muramoyltetrapeptide carboxypeptidase
MPRLDGAILAVEDDQLSDPAMFARDLTSLLQQPDAAGIRGLIIGRFQQASGMTRDLLEEILQRQNPSLDCP